MKNSKRLQSFYNSYTKEEAVKSVSAIIIPQMYKLTMPHGDFLQSKMPESLQTKWSKLLADVDQNAFILETIIDAIFKQGDINEYPELYDLGITDLTPAKVSMIFGGFPTKQQHNKFVKLIKARLGNEFIVMSVNGDHTTNKKAEERVKKSIGTAKLKGKRVILVSKDMASRSFSIPEIDTVFLMYDNGNIAQTIQKVSRAFTPGKTYTEDKKTNGTIITLSFDDNRNELDPVDQYLIGEAIRTGDEHESLQESIKRVARSFNIFSNEEGQANKINPDGYSELLISSTSLSNINGAANKFGDLDIQAITNANVILGLRKKIKQNHEASVNISGAQTYTKSKSNSESDKPETDFDSTEERKILTTILTFSQNIGELSVFNNYECDTALCILDNIIDSNTELIEEVQEFFGMDINFMRSLLQDDIVSRKISNTIIKGINISIDNLEPVL